MVSNVTSTLTSNVKQIALDAGFVAVGITIPDRLENLPHGWVGQARRLQPPEEEFPPVNSIIVMAFYVWDEIFNINIRAPNGIDSGNSSSFDSFEGYFISYEVMKNKAWKVIQYLESQGHNAIYSAGIPLKPIAVQCGLGWQGKSTLLVTPHHGPRVNLIAILTDAELDCDEPFQEDLCKDCMKCVKACPAQALAPYECNIFRCIVYALECPDDPEVPEKVRKIEQRLTARPTVHSYIECSRCMDVCPYGNPSRELLEQVSESSHSFVLRSYAL